MPRALLLTGDAAEELDTMYPYYRVQEGGWDVDVATATMRDVQLVIHEFDPNSDAYVEKNGRKLPVDVPWSDVDVELYDALIIPGGRAPEWIRVDPDVRRITEHFFARDLPDRPGLPRRAGPGGLRSAEGPQDGVLPAHHGRHGERRRDRRRRARRRRRQPGLVPRLARHAAVRPGDDGALRQVRRLHACMSASVVRP